MNEQVEAAIKQYEATEIALSDAIIAGEIEGDVLARILTANARHNTATLRLMLAWGDSRFIRLSVAKPFIWILYTVAAAVIGTAVAVAGGRIA